MSEESFFADLLIDIAHRRVPPWADRSDEAVKGLSGGAGHLL